MGTVAHSQPHTTITAKFFCFSGTAENMTVALSSTPALAAGGCCRIDHFTRAIWNSTLISSFTLTLGERGSSQLRLPRDGSLHRLRNIHLFDFHFRYLDTSGLGILINDYLQLHV